MLRASLPALALAAAAASCASTYEVPPASPATSELSCEAAGDSRTCIQIDILPSAPCPAGARWDGSACVAAAAEAAPSLSAAPPEAHACAPGHLVDCTAQCNNGHAGSCVLLGVMVLRGEGVPADEARAADLFERACKADELAGCNNLGVAFSEAQGRPRSYARAIELFRQACYGGTPEGCTNLGELYETGRGVEQDYAAAAARYEQACRGGVQVGCAALGLLVESGRVGPADGERALHLYARACGDPDYLVEQCEGGDLDGCAAYGVCLFHGLGTAPDRERAARYLGRGCQWGLAGACDKARAAGGAPPVPVKPAPGSFSTSAPRAAVRVVL